MADYRYLAGLIDGDGCIALYRHKDSKARSGYSFTPMIAITAKDTLFLDVLLSEYGGYINYSRIKSGFGGTGTNQLKFSANECRDLLPKIIPHLILKREEAELLKDALDITKYGRYKTASQIEQLENIVDMLKFLKKNRSV